MAAAVWLQRSMVDFARPGAARLELCRRLSGEPPHLTFQLLPDRLRDRQGSGYYGFRQQLRHTAANPHGRVSGAAVELADGDPKPFYFLLSMRRFGMVRGDGDRAVDGCGAQSRNNRRAGDYQHRRRALTRMFHQISAAKPALICAKNRIAIILIR